MTFKLKIYDSFNSNYYSIEIQILILNSNTNYYTTILFNFSCCYTDDIADHLLSAKPSPCLQNYFFQKYVSARQNLIEIIRKAKGRNTSKAFTISKFLSLFILFTRPTSMLFNAQLFHSFFFTLRFVYVYNLPRKTQLLLKISWNHKLPDSERMTKVNLDDTSLGKFSK